MEFQINQNELITKISEDIDMPKKQVKAVIKGLTVTIFGSITAGEEITLHGIGKFGVKAVAARTGRNPKTGEAIQIEDRNKPTFSAAKTLKDAANQ